MNNKLKIFLKSVYVVVVTPIIFVASCSTITPTVVPPLTDDLGYHVPNYKNITTMGIIEGSYKYQVEKLKLWKFSVDFTLDTTEGIRSKVMDLATAIGLGGTASLPFAFKKLPKGAQWIKEEEKA